MDEHGNYKLGDFGVSKLMDGSGMAETAVCTKPYGAPEVFQFKPYTIQADIYSLGIVLYRLANDYKYPFSNDVSMVGIETSIANRLKGLKLPTPSLDAPKLNKIILKACAFETKNRYANIDSMLKDLEAIQSNDKERVPLNVDTSTVNKVIESEPKNFTTRLLNKIKSLSKRKANDIKDAPTITQESNFKEFNIERTTEIIIGREQALVEYKSEKNVSIKFDGCVGNILDEAFSHFFELEHLSIEDGAYSLGNKSFYGCHNLKYVKLPNSLEIIGESAFNGCSNLESIELSKGLKTIGDNAFYGCSKLERVEIPNGVTNIGKFAFFLCSRLKEVTVPESVVNIGLYAFPKDNFSSLVIKCGEGTEMYRYCVDNHIKYKLIT
jgi:serine/threonine protein kinase